jgi:DNA-3-methyladenine glycosylase
MAGLAYVYLIYGMYHCLNVVTEAEGFPAAILIRAIEPQEGLGTMREFRSGRPDRELTSGPGRLCQALAIDRTFTGCDLCSHPNLFIEEGEPPARITTGTRIGISADPLARERPWRFCVADNPFVSSRSSSTPRGAR